MGSACPEAVVGLARRCCVLGVDRRPAASDLAAYIAELKDEVGQTGASGRPSMPINGWQTNHAGAKRAKKIAAEVARHAKALGAEVVSRKAELDAEAKAAFEEYADSRDGLDHTRLARMLKERKKRVEKPAQLRAAVRALEPDAAKRGFIGYASFRVWWEHDLSMEVVDDGVAERWIKEAKDRDAADAARLELMRSVSRGQAANCGPRRWTANRAA